MGSTEAWSGRIPPPHHTPSPPPILPTHSASLALHLLGLNGSAVMSCTGARRGQLSSVFFSHLASSLTDTLDSLIYIQQFPFKATQCSFSTLNWFRFRTIFIICGIVTWRMALVPLTQVPPLAWYRTVWLPAWHPPIRTRLSSPLIGQSHFFSVLPLLTTSFLASHYGNTSHTTTTTTPLAWL